MIKNTESPKGQVHEIAASQGADAARLLVTKNADKEGWSNAVKKVEIWLRDWGISGSPPEVVQKSSPLAKPQIAKGKKNFPAKPVEARRRVYDVGNPNVHGMVLTAGEQVSLVRWDVHSPWGKESHVSNEQLKDVANAPTKQTLDVFNKARAFRVMRKDKEHSTHKSFTEAQGSAGNDDGLWVYAISGGGTVVLLMRPHWGVLLNHEAARKIEGVAKRVLK